MGLNLGNPDLRTLRVFISSTFRDMQAEREQLVKHIFPRLRERCEERGVIWGDVDLRWGISDEEKAEGNVLPICMTEIEHCRPHFICILGERYGWVPTNLSEDLIARQPWMADCRDHSVTDLEIMHGVLNHPEAMPYAYFYLRDPGYIKNLPVEQQHEFQETPTLEELSAFGREEAERRCADRKQKLASLKDRIRQSGGKVRENYLDPIALGELVLKDFYELIDQLYPQGSDDRDAREEAQQTAYASNRKLVYIPDLEYLARLDTHATGTDESILVVSGEAGVGKSALLANWAEHFKSAFPDLSIVSHYVGASTQSADWTAMLLRLMRLLWTPFATQRLGNYNPFIPSGSMANLYQTSRIQREALKASFNHFVNYGLSNRTVVIIDGIDQMEDQDHAPDLDWLPRVLPLNLCLIVSCRPGTTLNRLLERGCSTLAMTPLKAEARVQLIQKYLADYGKKLNPAQVTRIAFASPTANTLYLCALLEELRVYGDHFTLNEYIGHCLEAQDLTSLFKKILQRYEADYELDNPGLVGKAMSLLWASHRGISETDLLDLLGSHEQPLPQANWSTINLAARWAITNRAGRLSIVNEDLRNAVQNRYLPDENYQCSVHQLLADYFSRKSGRLTGRFSEEYPWHLQKTGAWDELFKLLADTTFLVSAWGQVNLLRKGDTILPYELPLWQKDRESSTELRTYWREIENHTTLRMEEAYKPILEEPGTYMPCLLILDQLFEDTGHYRESLRLRTFLTEHCAIIGDRASLARAQLMQAACFELLGDPDPALARINEASEVFDHLGDVVGVQECTSRRIRIEKMCQLIHQYETNTADIPLNLLNNQPSPGRDLIRKGYSYAIQGDHPSAEIQFEKAKLVLEEKNDPEGMMMLLDSRAMASIRQKKIGEALQDLQASLNICRKTGNLLLLSWTRGWIAIILRAQGEFERSMEMYQEQERALRSLSDSQGLQESLANQAELAGQMGQIHLLDGLYQEIVKVTSSANIKSSQAEALFQGAWLHIEKEEWNQANQLLEKAEQISRQQGEKKILAKILDKLGYILARQGETERALAFNLESQTLFKEIGDRAGLAEAMMNRAIPLINLGNLDEAKDLFIQAEQIMRDANMPKSLVTCLKWHAALLAFNMKQPREALSLANEAYNLACSIGFQTEIEYSRNLLNDIRGRLTFTFKKK